MVQSKFDLMANRLGVIFGLLFMLIIIVSVILIGDRLLEKAFFLRADKTAVATINEQTGEKEYLSLGRFIHLEGAFYHGINRSDFLPCWSISLTGKLSSADFFAACDTKLAQSHTPIRELPIEDRRERVYEKQGDILSRRVPGVRRG